MSDRIPMTRNGYDKLKSEVDQLDLVEMPRLTQRVAAARSEGDLSENAEYHGARESQGLLQAKINLLRDKLARAVIVERAKEATDEVVFGATVVVRDLKFGDNEVFVLVGAGARLCSSRSRAAWSLSGRRRSARHHPQKRASEPSLDHSWRVPRKPNRPRARPAAGAGDRPRRWRW